MTGDRCEVCGDNGYRMPLRTTYGKGYEACVCDGPCETQWLAVNGSDADKASALELLAGTRYEDTSCVAAL